MKLTVLGNCGPYPRAGGACSGYLFESNGVKILLDCGNGTLSRLQQIVENLEDIDMVILSHLHSDHISDAMVLRYALGIHRMKGKIHRSIPLYAPGTPVEDYLKLQFKDAFELNRIEDYPEFVYKNLSIKFKKMDHPVDSYGIIIESDGKKFVYSGDTKICENIVVLAQGADLFLCESGLLEKDKTHNTAHLSAKDAGEVGKKANVKRLLLTHFWPEYDLMEIYEEAKAAFGDGIELAMEMKIYTL